MTISSGQVTVGTVATYITGADPNPAYVHIHNADNTKTVFLGGPGVTITTGLNLLKEDSFEIFLHPGRALYAVIQTGTSTLSWLKQQI